MPRYEFVEGNSSKFWEITLEGTSFTTTYGRLGTEGQTSLKEWDTEAKARKEYDKLIAEKVKKGYVLVSGEAAEVESAPAATPAPAAKDKPKAKSAVFEDEGDEEEAPKPKAKKGKEKPAGEAEAAAKSSKGTEEGARYFEFVEGNSSKFWEVRLEGTSVLTRYGRIGASGQETMKEFDSVDKAKKEYDKLVSEKTKKGYVEK